jgi:hypothetical protein
MKKTPGSVSLGSSSLRDERRLARARRDARREPRAAHSYLTDRSLLPYPARVTQTSRSFYFSGFFYYGFPLAGRDWRRTRE